jgi:Fic/DOC family
MFNPTLLTQIDALKVRLDRLRPLAPDLVDNLREVYNIRLTYHSNAIEGNTLTQSETQIVIEKGITIGGKPLKDHLEAINHVEAIDFIRDLAMDERAITEWDIRQIHGLVCKGDRGAGAYRTVNVMAAGSNYRYPDAIMVPELMQGFSEWLQSAPALHPTEIIAEARFELDVPRQPIWSPVECLSVSDCFTSKLLANADRYADPSVHSRDLIDLAFLRNERSIPDLAIEKAEVAYRVMIPLKAALSKFQADADLRFHCYENLTISKAFRSKLIDGIDLLAIDLGLDKTSRTISESGDELFPFM